MGSESLRVEMLSLFVTEVERLLRQVCQARDSQMRRDRLNAVRTLARNIGARRLEEAARLADLDSDLPDPDNGPLEHAVAEVVAYIRAAGS